MTAVTIPLNKPVKVNIGCETRLRPGYINIDRDGHPGVDIVCDAAKIDLPDGCAEEVYASHILEHFTHDQTVPVLKEWRRLLAPEGLLKISVPDFARAMELYSKAGLSDWLVYFIWGDQKSRGAFHYTGFNEQRLTDCLKVAGFSDIIRVDAWPDVGRTEAANLVSNYDRRPISLNMLAKK